MNFATMQLDNNKQAFFVLVRAGLWEDLPVHGEGLMVNGSSNLDWEEVYKLAEEQSVVGLVLAGIERLKNANYNLNLNQELLLQWIGEVQVIEQQNKAMNEFVAELIEKLRKRDIYTLLVKGQGVAQCYERPLWRACGDIDLLLNDNNYQKSKSLLIPISDNVETEFTQFKHLGMSINGWTVELHGTLRPRLTKAIDNIVDKVQGDVFYGGNVRSWLNGDTQVFLPGVDSDIIFLFTHILKHFYQGGVGLRQICDWCRFLWCYRSKLDLRLLEARINESGLMSEWKTFAALAVDFLGMPVEAMPLYSPRKKWTGKAIRVCKFVMKVGNLGNNRIIKDTTNQPFLIQKINSLWLRTADSARHFFLFPKNAIYIWIHLLYTGLVIVLKNKRING